DAYIRIEDISLSYTLPAAILNRIKLKNLKIFLEGRNLFTITKWTGLDPELSSQIGLPLQKDYSVGINLSL
ncbi:MAG: TonB-dependent receptor, partial [Chitinophagaceae bacterium]|nr:TonB-dependent receptor [Chitinophagaceae bacterium]